MTNIASSNDVYEVAQRYYLRLSSLLFYDLTNTFIQILGLPVPHYKTSWFGLIHCVNMATDWMALPFWCIDGLYSTRIQYLDHQTFTEMGEIKEKNYG